MTGHADLRIRHRVATAAVFAVTAVAAVVVFHGALDDFFNQDDFTGLARAREIVHLPPSAFRYVSQRIFYAFLSPIGLNATPYHAVILSAHVLSSLLLLLLLRRSVSLPAAWVGATFFAVHPAIFRALYWISCASDVFALAFVLAAWHVARLPERRRWLALPLFALSVLSKESTLLWPVVLFADQRRGSAARTGDTHPSAARADSGARKVDPLVVGSAVVSALVVLILVISSRRGVPSLLGGAAYTMSFDAGVWKNLLNYLGWTVAVVVRSTRGIPDSVDPRMFPVGAVALIAWLGGLALRPLRTRGWAVAGLLYCAFLLPVLPLSHHSYRYYLYGPLAGAAWCVAALMDAAFGATQRQPQRVRSASDERALSARRAAQAAGRGDRQRRRTPIAADPTRSRARSRAVAPSVCAIVVVGALIANGVSFVHRTETEKLSWVDEPYDPTLRRAGIAERMFHDLRAAHIPAGVDLYFWSPSSLSLERAHGRAPRTGPVGVTYWETDVQSALEGDVGVKLMVPQVRSVRFVHYFVPAGDSVWYAVYGPDGETYAAATSTIESLVRSQAKASHP
jgi:hypothetical protein